MFTAGTMNIMNKWRKHQMKIIDSWLSTKAYLLMHIFGTRLVNDLRLSLRDWEKLKHSRLRQPNTQDLAHVTIAKTKFYKEQKKEILWIKKRDCMTTDR